MAYRFVEIGVNAPAYRGAPMPRYNELMVNESEFDDGFRFKSAELYAYINDEKPEDSYGEVTWLSQEKRYADDDFKDEVARAFEANGVPTGAIITVKFGSRDSGIVEEFEIEI